MDKVTRRVPNPQPVIQIEDLQCGDHIIKIMQWLSHPHQNDIRDRRISLDRANLIDDFSDRQISRQAESAGKAELALHGATNLG